MRLRYFLPPAALVVFGRADVVNAKNCVVGYALDWNQNDNNNDGWTQVQKDDWNGNADDTSVSALAGGQPAENSIPMATHTMNPYVVTVAEIMSSTAVPTTLRTMTTQVAGAVSAAGVVSAADVVSAEAMSAAATTSNFMLTVTAVPKADRRPQTDSSSTLAIAIVVPLLALIAIVSAIVFRMYRTKKEREEAFAAEAVRAKTRAIEKQMEDLDAISEKYDMGKYRTPEAKGFEDAKSFTVDIPIQLEADEPDKKRFHGL